MCNARARARPENRHANAKGGTAFGSHWLKVISVAVQRGNSKLVSRKLARDLRGVAPPEAPILHAYPHPDASSLPRHASARARATRDANRFLDSLPLPYPDDSESTECAAICSTLAHFALPTASPTATPSTLDTECAAISSNLARSSSIAAAYGVSDTESDAESDHTDLPTDCDDYDDLSDASYE